MKQCLFLDPNILFHTIESETVLLTSIKKPNLYINELMLKPFELSMLLFQRNLVRLLRFQ